MGKLEKLVVLTVFFFAGVVLTVSMHSGKEAAAGGSSPAEALHLTADGSGLGVLPSAPEGGRETLAQAPQVEPATPTDDLAGRDVDASAAESLSDSAAEASVAGSNGPEAASNGPEAAPNGPEAAPATLDPRAGPPLLSATGERDQPPVGVLRSVPGLTATIHDDFLRYVCRGDETFAGLAIGLYGDRRYADPIRKLNPSVLSLEPGTELMLARDARPEPLRSTALPAQPLRPTPAGGAVPALGSAAVGSAAVVADGATDAPAEERRPLGQQFRLHTVERGETLSRIASRFYGDANLWRRIYDQNRDVISNPDRVAEGTVLKIP
jgi:nucleoid-associated protein YgaU